MIPPQGLFKCLTLSSAIFNAASLEVEVVTVSYQDTENLVSEGESSLGDVSRPTPHSARKTLYTSSTRCCTTRSSILISKGVILLVGVAVLIVGGVLAWTVSPRLQINCNSNNCSAYCQQSSLSLPVPTLTRDAGRTTPPFAVVPTPTLGGGVSRSVSLNSIPPLIPTPSPVVYTTSPSPERGDVFSPNGTLCDCPE